MQSGGRIIVEDLSRARFHVREYRGTRIFKRLRVLVLVETGQRVKQRTVDTFVIAATGEPLVLVDGSSNVLPVSNDRVLRPEPFDGAPVEFPAR